MNTILLFLALFLLAALGLLAVSTLGETAITATARIAQRLAELVGGVVERLVTGAAVGLVERPLAELAARLTAGVAERLIIQSVERLLLRQSIRRKGPAKAIEAQDDQRPPPFAEYLLYFLPKAKREPLLGDLEEEYREVYTKFGKRKATIWYYVQVALSFWPLLARGARKLVKWGVLGWISGVVRRLIP